MTEPKAAMTLFSTCKPVLGEIGAMQCNALISWARLGLKIILFGDEPGVAELARETGARHIPHIERSPSGHPLISAMFEAARQISDTEYLAYSNADILLMPDFLTTLEAVFRQADCSSRFFLTGRRQHIPLSRRLTELQFANNTLPELIAQYGCWDKSNAMDLFLFHRDLFNDLPPLTVGRMQWDNWLLWKAVQENAMVIDASAAMTLLHPIHGYGSSPGGWRQFTQDDDARNNRELCAGNLLTLEQAATHYLINGKLMAREKDCKIPSQQPNRNKLFAGGLAYLQEGFEQRPLPETIDCIRNLLWNNDTYFPLNYAPESAEENYDADTVLQSLQTASAGNYQQGLNSLQDLLSDRFLMQIQQNEVARPIYIWGCGQLGQRLQALFNRRGINFCGFLDSNKTQINKIINGKTVISNHWRDVSKADGTVPYIVIASMYYREIAETLQASGLSLAQDFVA